MASKKVVVLVARESFVYAVKGVEYVVKQGDQYSSNHPAAKAHPELFAPHRDAGVLAWTRTHVWRLVTPFVLLFIASLVIPALTKQWGDRKQELQVKESLLTDFSKASANAVYEAVGVLSKKGKRQRATRDALVSTWQRDRNAIDLRFRVYFDGSEAANHWFGEGSLARGLYKEEDLSFRQSLRRYVLLACCDVKDRPNHLGRLRDYLYVTASNVAPDGPVWSTLKCGPQEGCEMNSAYRRAYQWLGVLLLDQRDSIMVDQVLKANAEGFSSGWRDFISDLNPVG